MRISVFWSSLNKLAMWSDALTHSWAEPAIRRTGRLCSQRPTPMPVPVSRSSPPLAAAIVRRERSSTFIVRIWMAYGPGRSRGSIRCGDARCARACPPPYRYAGSYVRLGQDGTPPHVNDTVQAAAPTVHPSSDALRPTRRARPSLDRGARSGRGHERARSLGLADRERGCAGGDAPRPRVLSLVSAPGEVPD